MTKITEGMEIITKRKSPMKIVKEWKLIKIVCGILLCYGECEKWQGLTLLHIATSPFTSPPKIYTKIAIPAVKSNLKVIKVLGNKTEISYIYHRIQWYSM